MDEKKLMLLLEDEGKVDKEIESFIHKNLLSKQQVVESEIKGHIQKAEHNANFVKDTLGQGYSDWAVVGCYYAVYHIALALILKKGYFSKNHDATLSVLIKEYCKKNLSNEDIELMNSIYLSNEDVLFYANSKQERKKASYSTQIVFDKENVESLRLKTILFVNKAKSILINS